MILGSSLPFLEMRACLCIMTLPESYFFPGNSREWPKTFCKIVAIRFFY